MIAFVRRAAGWVAAAALGLALAAGGEVPKKGVAPPAPRRSLTPFLDEFRARREPAIATQAVAVPTAVGRLPGYLARPDTGERLPAVLLLGDDGLTDWLKLSARELASVGYVVLAAEPGGGRRADPADERTLAELSAAVRWLRRRPDVKPERVGVAGWGRGGGRALALAAAAPLQACVTCDGPLEADPALLAGLRGTPVLVVCAGEGPAGKALPAFRKALAAAGIPHQVEVYAGVAPGFMGPPGGKAYPHRAAEKAWFEVYEFLGKYVEDATPPAVVVNPPAHAVATVADLMRAVNGTSGVRGGLLRSLDSGPRDEAAWARVRADAALLAEAGLLLQARSPRRGPHGHWREQARAFTAAAESVAAAADRHDLAAARGGLERLNQTCAACHKQHR